MPPTDRTPGHIALIGVDWGSTRLRAHAFDAQGGVIAMRETERGMATLSSPQAFADALDELLDTGVDDGRAPILLAGMVGARQGWVEVPYANLPADASSLAAALQPLDYRDRRAAIVPGVCGPDDDFSDVMRGEETQALGVPTGTRHAVAPGTHSKWLTLHDGRVEAFATYLTGELYAVLMQHSLIGRGLPAQAWSDRGFRNGLDTARERPDWLHQLFGVRARLVRNKAPAEELPAFLSGLLIGYECAAALTGTHRNAMVAVIGGAQISAAYAQALRHFDTTPYLVDGDTAFRTGIWRIAQAARFV